MKRSKISLAFLASCFWIIVCDYLHTHQPRKNIRIPHAFIIVAVTLQLLSTPFVKFDVTGHVSVTWYHVIGTWFHLINGIGLFVVTPFFAYQVLHRKGLRWMYPYLFGNLKEMNKDFHELLQIRLTVPKAPEAEKATRAFIILEQMRLPRPRPASLAAAVQGVGIAIQLLMVFLGFFFLLTWAKDLNIAWDIIAVHRILAIPFFLFYAGHGPMGLIHIFNLQAQQRMQKIRTDDSGKTTGMESCKLPK